MEANISDTDAAKVERFLESLITTTKKELAITDLFEILRFPGREKTKDEDQLTPETKLHYLQKIKEAVAVKESRLTIQSAETSCFCCCPKSIERKGLDIPVYDEAEQRAVLLMHIEKELSQSPSKCLVDTIEPSNCCRKKSQVAPAPANSTPVEVFIPPITEETPPQSSPRIIPVQKAVNPRFQMVY